MDLYQSLVTVNPVTLIAQICNLFLQMFLVKVFFLDKIKAILDARREAADKEITDAKTAKEEAMVIKATYEQNMLEARAKADDLLLNAQRTANSRSEEIIGQAQQAAEEKAMKEILTEKQYKKWQMQKKAQEQRMRQMMQERQQNGQGGPGFGGPGFGGPGGFGGGEF